MPKYSDLNLKLKCEPRSIKVNGIDIQVYPFLSTQDRNTLILNSIKASLEDGIVNQTKLDAYFNFHLICLCSDLTFTEEDMKDEFELYDILDSNGVINTIIAALDTSFYDSLVEDISKMIKDIYSYESSLGGIVSNLMAALPKNAEAVKEIMGDFDKEKYQDILDLAKANGIDNSVKK